MSDSADYSAAIKPLADSGYFVGSTGKAWSPGRLEPGGRTENPAGPVYAERTFKPPHRGMYLVLFIFLCNLLPKFTFWGVYEISLFFYNIL